MSPSTRLRDVPTEADAAEIALRATGMKVETLRRFSTGLGHWVYDVRLVDGRSVVVRLGSADQQEDFEGARHWSKTLRPLGVPLPELLEDGEQRGLPYLVLERLPGADLGQVYHLLTSAQRRSIAEEVCHAQRIVGTLPAGRAFGFMRLPAAAGHSSWGQVVESSLARSRHRLESAGLLGTDAIDRVAASAERFQKYFARVRPTPFLDDATTKNVLVHSGKLSGIVDVDWLCFGDPLFTVGLTRMALLNQSADLEYTDHWCNLLDLDAEQRSVVHVYTALFCVDFMSEFGQHFNQGTVPLDSERAERLVRILDDHLA